MLDAVILEVDKALRTLFVQAPTVRAVPGVGERESVSSARERERTGALMRVNHVGEVCAQALYQGQALGCRSVTIRESLKNAASEETEHLAWTARRIEELGVRKSALNPLWYLGALSIGFVAGKMGDAWSLGFLVETERQVVAHLKGHLVMLGPNDMRSRAIVEQMIQDEKNHADVAAALGASELSLRVRIAMRCAALVMTQVSAHV